MIEALIAGLGSLLVVAGYMLVKKFARSRCAIDHCSGCFTCESPEVELQKKHTERLDQMFEIIRQIVPQIPPPEGTSLGSPVTHTLEQIEVSHPTTNGEL